MKFKKFIKDNIKRISAVILCMILLFTCSITALAFDGEAPSKVLTSNDLLEYHEETYVYYNSHGDPIYSPFNFKVTNSVMSLSTTSGGSSGTVSLDTDVYFSISTEYLGSFYGLKTYYIIPATLSDYNIFDAMKDKVLNWTNLKVGWYNIFSLFLEKSYSTGSSSSNTYPIFDFSKLGNIWSVCGLENDFFTTNGHLPALVYSVDFNKEGLIYNISYGGYYEDIAEAFKSLGRLIPSQVAMHDKSDHSSVSPLLSSCTLMNEPELYSDVINTNKYISTSTYSLTAMDYFAYEEVDNSGSYITLKSNYYSCHIGSYFYNNPYIPSHFLKEEFRSDSTFTQLSKDSTNEKYYGNREIYEEGKSWILIGYNGSATSYCYGGYYLEFPDGTNPIVYLKLIKESSIYKPLYAQILSKVDYKIYASIYMSGQYNSLMGTFDAETSTYSGTSFTAFQAVDYYNNTSSLANQTVSKYPSIMIGQPSSNGYTQPALSSVVFGMNCVASCYSTETQGVGFYYYISPENIPNIIQNSNSYNPGIGGGGGNGNYQPPFDSDLDWEKFWDFTIDYDSMKSDAFKGYELTPYPDLPFKSLDGINLFTIPDDLLDYMVSCIQWYGDNLNSFIDYVGGPVGKMLTMMRMIFENCPDVLKFLFMLFFFFFAAMKIMQFDTGYLLAQTSSDINSQILAQNREIQKRNESIIREQNRVAAIQAREEAQRHKAAVAETKRRQTWRGWKSSTSSEASLKEKFESKFGSKDGGS